MGGSKDKTRHASEAEPRQEEGFLAGLVNNLLYGAASRLERGPTTCIRCKGAGTQTCNVCKGAGVLSPEKVRMNQIRHTTNRLRGVQTDWMQSNRCRQCHGTGRITCPSCGGMGVYGTD
ncbi:hypothetical protein WJX72_009695 [[Myrmecia] bisecta]|uniref:Uncharacterized protein n=1 Tax=[Myrmecia] bisecta TaxID=41462 RepID=A0AAW1P910_9CHLO